MICRWTNEDIEQILLQLNQRDLPFKRYTFSKSECGLKLLGSGGNAKVYEAVRGGKEQKQYAIKIIGFGDGHVDSENFKKIVEIQKELGRFQDYMVKIFDRTELRVWIEGDHNVVKVREIKEEEEEIPEGDFLHLQFIVMEKLIPVLKSDSMGRTELFPPALDYLEKKKNPAALVSFEDWEILKLAHDIGMALAKAHKEKLIHRDVKLENIFYSSKKKCYKLGDFGIAKITRDGMASTVAFTKGYGAPEVVGKLDDKYDYTADIYSFGILLYVLLNELRFPESKNYHVNLKAQYSQGYLPPWPKHGTGELCRVVEKMCRFYPDDRYQCMDEVLNDLDMIIYGESVKYKREHKKASLVLGSVFLLLGGGLLLADRFSLLPTEIVTKAQSFRWVMITLLVLGIALLREYEAAEIRDLDVTRMYLKANLIWLFIGINSVCLITLGLMVLDMIKNPTNIFSRLLGPDFLTGFLAWNPIEIGSVCLIFCLFWKGREMWLSWCEKNMTGRI